jgi:hypothetical protein
MGYSSDDVLRDLNKKHFVRPLDSNSETQLQQLNASSKLLDALKSGQFDATADQVTQAEQKIAVVKTEAQDIARQQRIALEIGENAKRNSGTVQRGQERPHPATRVVDLQIGQVFDLREVGGPNIRVVVHEVGMDDVLVTLLDYDHMQVVGSGDGSGYLTSIGSAPTPTRKRVGKEEGNSLIYSWGRSKLVYLDVLDVAQNHVKLGIVSE